MLDFEFLIFGIVFSGSVLSFGFFDPLCPVYVFFALDPCLCVLHMMLFAFALTVTFGIYLVFRYLLFVPIKYHEKTGISRWKTG